MSGERWKKQPGAFSFVRRHVSDSHLNIPTRQQAISFDLSGQTLRLDSKGWTQPEDGKGTQAATKDSPELLAKIKELEERNNMLLHKHELMMGLLVTTRLDLERTQQLCNDYKKIVDEMNHKNQYEAPSVQQTPAVSKRK